MPSSSKSVSADSATRRKILRAARRLLLREGQGDLSLRAVARATHLAPSSIYEHFADRAAIIEALAGDALAERGAELTRACTEGASSRERLVAASTVYLRFAHERPHEFDLCFSRVQPRDRTVPPPTSPLMPVIAELVRALSCGELLAPDGFDALDMAVSLWTQLHGIAVLRAGYLSQLPDLEEKAARIVSGTIAGWLPLIPSRRIPTRSPK
jgi:AcrR family transcriptional regulator